MKVFSPLFATVLAAFLFITACSHKDAPGTVTPPPTPALSVDKTTITQMAAAGTASIAVTSNISWKVTSSQTWATISPATGSNNGNVTVTIAANAGTDLRTADITIASSESGSSLTPHVIKITQGGSDPYLMVDNANITISGGGGIRDVKVTSNVAWTLNIPTTATWITADKTSGTAGETTVRYTIAANTSMNVQMADITYTATSANPVKTTFIENVNYLLTSFSPVGAPVGSTVTLNGIFAINSIVKFNGVQATNVVVAPDGKSLTCTVPTGATIGKITAEFGGNTSTSPTDFVVTAGSSYSIGNFTPGTLRSNDRTTHITIAGNFDVTATPVVKVNGVVAPVVGTPTATSIIITLPAGATDGKITVTFGGNTYSSASDFLVTNRWAQVSTGHGAYFSPAEMLTFTRNGQVYIGLGYDNSGTNYKPDFKIFDPSITASNKWLTNGITIPNNMQPRIFASSFVLNGIVYIGGGYGGYNQSELSDWWSYNSNGVWTNITDYPSAGMGGLGFVVNNTAYAGNPFTSNSGILSQFNPAGSGSWPTFITNTALSNRYSSTFVIADDAYIVAGEGAAGTTNTTVKITPAATTPISYKDNFPVSWPDMPGFTLKEFGYVIFNQDTYKFDPSAMPGNQWTNTLADLTEPIYGVHSVQVVNDVAYAFTPTGIVYKFIP